MKIHHFINYWLPALLWGMLIFSFSSGPVGQVGESYWVDVVVKKIAHVIEYAIFTGLLYRAFYNSGNDIKKSLKISFAIAVAYAFTDEFHQSYTPTREPHLRDVMFDTIGASITVYIIWKLLPILPKKLKRWAKNLDLL